VGIILRGLLSNKAEALFIINPTYKQIACDLIYLQRPSKIFGFHCILFIFASAHHNASLFR